MTKFDQIKMRYNRGFVTPLHLAAYLRLGVITKLEHDEILSITESPPTDDQSEE